MKNYIYSIITVLVLAVVGFGQDIEAITKDGKKVILKSDKTWEYVADRNSDEAQEKKEELTNETLNGGVLNGRAVNLPKPRYPSKARKSRASGAVNVQVVIDENGKVFSAKAISGDELLRDEAVSAALKATFKPTTISGRAVKVGGVIVYYFLP